MRTSLVIVSGYLLLLFISLFVSTNMITFQRVMDAVLSTNAKEIALSKQYIADLQDKQFNSVTERLAPALKNYQSELALLKISDLFPNEKPMSTTLVGFSKNVTTNLTTITSIFQYKYPHKWITAEVVLEKNDDATNIKGISIIPPNYSLEDRNSFNLYGKNPSQYLFLLITLIVSVIIIIALTLCIPNSNVKRRWLRTIFILTGVGTVALNWTDGTFQILLLHIQILGVGVYKFSPYNALIVYASIPIGAIVFLFHWLKTRTAPTKTNE
jgi:hypothetical protein